MKVSKSKSYYKSTHHKEKICNYVWWWWLSRPIVVIILQNTQISNHYVIHPKLNICWLHLKNSLKNTLLQSLDAQTFVSWPLFLIFNGEKSLKSFPIFNKEKFIWRETAVSQSQFIRKYISFQSIVLPSCGFLPEDSRFTGKAERIFSTAFAR